MIFPGNAAGLSWISKISHFLTNRTKTIHTEGLGTWITMLKAKPSSSAIYSYTIKYSKNWEMFLTFCREE